MMQAEEENEKHNADLHVTPCTNLSHKNLLHGFTNSGDSGFFSNTPSSEELCSKGFQSVSQHSESTYVTPHVTNTGFHRMDYESCPRSNSTNNFNSGPFPIQTSCLISPVRYKNSCIRTLSGDSLLGDSAFYCDTSDGIHSDESISESRLFGTINDNNKTSSNTLTVAIHKDHSLKRSSTDDYGSDISSRGKIKPSLESASGDESVYKDCEQSTFYEDVFMSDDSSDDVEQRMRLTPKKPQTVSPLFTNKFLSSPLRSKFSSIRKSLFGFEHVDILYFLGQKQNHTTVVSKILSYLPSKDLQNVSMVSKTWKQVVQNDSKARKRLTAHRRSNSASKENIKMTADTKRKLSLPFSRFSEIQNIQPTSPKKAPVSPIPSPRSRRFHFFYKEGEKLDRKSKLMPCPRCTLPARCSSTGDNLGVCLRAGCQYRFCTNCRAEFHNPKHCFRISSCPMKKNSMVIGSKASKRRLSRT